MIEQDVLDAAGGSQERRKDIVQITVNEGEPIDIHRGRQTVAEIKRLGGVPVADVLAQVIDGKLVPLDDNGAVVLKGGEKFMSYPRDSGSSHC